jgi:predicted CxxxxCH...CXXCH cytochrome family protein
MKLTASAAVAVVAMLCACADVREVDEGGASTLHAIPFGAEHTAAARADIASCKVCHGAELAGGAAESCTACHEAPAPEGAGFAGDWRTNCTFCHGTGRDPAWSGDLAAVAPPQSADGADPQDGTNPAVGAHQAHLVAGTFSKPLSCDSCHALPPLTFPGSLAHVDGTADVEFSTTAVGAVAAPGYDRATGSCAVACHGSTEALGNLTSPPWTSTGIGCGDCHAWVPESGFHTFHIFDQGVRCERCHAGYTLASVDLETHVNGTFEASIAANPAAFPRTKDAALSSWPTDCFACHE